MLTWNVLLQIADSADIADKDTSLKFLKNGEQEMAA